MLISVPVATVLWWFYRAVPFPYALDYNEGIVWKQMVEIAAGRGYAPIDGFPAIVFHYPPVFHLTAAALAETGLDPLVSGRVVSLISTAGSALIIGDLARRLTQPRRPLIAGVAMAAAMIVFLLFQAVHTWAPQMRVDAIACFFALAGLWCITRSDQRPALIYLAAICFVLSVFSKQVSVVTAAASFGALLLLRPRRAVPAITATVLLGLVVIAALTWQTNGGVLRHLFLYNINRFEVARLLPNLYHATKSDIPLLMLAAVGFFLILTNSRHNRRRWSELDLTTAAMLLFVPIATLSLVTTGKFGSSSSYYIQWEAGLAVFAAFAFALLVEAASKQLANGSTVRAAGWAAVPLILTLWTLGHRDLRHARSLEVLRLQDAEIVRLLDPVRGDIISDEMVILMRMHRNVVWEPAIFAELTRAGRWDEQLVIERIRDHRIGAVVSDGDRGFIWFDERYNPAVAAAMDEALPRKIRVGLRVVHLPAVTHSSLTATALSETPSAAAARK
ncbi:ArnT family glycosyltransferase [Glacieibacterium megasporae]|uniref:ArnT family glycosyltransferase n=1 Tax=Glacieibacterium megasporae TaxID=2835787 RepID=UPI0021025C1D|nr:glycosyltransferase family 39 protein [Polymorphobacter megasporae]